MKFQPQDKAAWNFILFYFNYIHSTHSFHTVSWNHSLAFTHWGHNTMSLSRFITPLYCTSSTSGLSLLSFLLIFWLPLSLCVCVLCSVFCAIGLCKFLLFRGKYFSFFIYLLKKICFKSLVKLLHWQVLGKFWTFQWQTFPIEILS